MAPKYQLVRPLGSGGMGEVFLGFINGANDFRRPVAIKRVRRNLIGDAQAVARFTQEARIGAKLDHPNIVSVLDLYEAQDGELHMVMEYVHGRSLHEILQATRLPLSAAVHILLEVLSGLAFAHKHGVVHLDIKPGNILVAHETGAVKIADFGLARLSAQNQEHDSGRALGTLAFCAPEQLLGVDVDERADLYSVGVMAYLMLTGRLPFQLSDRFGQALVQILHAPFPSPTELNPEIPPELDDVVMWLLQREPGHRYAHADTVIADLKALALGDSRAALLHVLAELDRPASLSSGLAPLPLDPDTAIDSEQRITLVAAPRPLEPPPWPNPHAPHNEVHEQVPSSGPQGQQPSQEPEPGTHSPLAQRRKRIWLYAMSLTAALALLLAGREERRSTAPDPSPQVPRAAHEVTHSPALLPSPTHADLIGQRTTAPEPPVSNVDGPQHLTIQQDIHDSAERRSPRRRSAKPPGSRDTTMVHWLPDVTDYNHW